MDRLFLFIATGAGSGYLPKAPGTWASALTVLLWLLAANFISFGLTPYLCFVATICCLGVVSAGAAEKLVDRPDPGLVVIDEVAGQLIALSAAPAHPLAALAGFVLFRIFDIFKPFPIRWLDQHIHGGLGIMLDDILAGLYALFALQLGLYLLKIY
ncbi:MAG: phosphatidylglycerophosphatase A [Desulfobulbaceae bacterium]|nr:phosphatidylglycerophosphatase A [Desulfobulbaceae bacterium]